MRKLFTAKVLISLLLPVAAFAAGAPAAPVEYKALVDVGSWPAVMKAYGPGLPVKEIEIYFYDTPGLALYQRGLVLRARTGKKRGDSTVKMRPAPPALPPGVSAARGFKCEYDSGPAASVYSCSLTSRQENGKIAAAAAGGAKAGKLFSGPQKAWAGGVDWDKLRALGPVKSSSWEAASPGLKTLSFERWDLPGGPSFLEVSFRAPGRAEAEEGIKTLHAELQRLGVKLAEGQSSKTRAAMDFFSK
ncbi:MAG: hypothetical protein Q7R35_17680 [Elusimicrobiota bacterium]|nr:hypothetical protein [Elusimicrobiota bacterium]